MANSYTDHVNSIIRKLTSKLDYVYVMISQGTNYIFPIFIFPLIINRLGLSKFGVFSLGIVTFQFFNLIIEYGFALSVAKKLNLINDKNQQSELYSSIIISKIILFLLSIIFVAFFFFFIEEELGEIFFVFSIGLILVVFNPSWYFQAKGSFRNLCFISVSSKLITLLIIYLNSINKVEVYFTIYISQYLFIFIVGNYLLFKNDLRLKIQKGILSKSFYNLKEGKNFFLSNFMASLYTLLTPVILGIATSKAEIGIYNNVNVLKQGIAGLFAPILQVTYTRTVKSTTLSTTVQAQFKNSLLIISGLIGFTLLVVLPGVFFADWICLYMFKEINQSYILAIRLSLISPIFIIFNSAFSSLFLLVTDNSKTMLKSIMVGSVVCLTFSFYISKIYGAVGILSLLIFVEILVAIMFLLNSIRLIKKV